MSIVEISDAASIDKGNHCGAHYSKVINLHNTITAQPTNVRITVLVQITTAFSSRYFCPVSYSIPEQTTGPEKSSSLFNQLLKRKWVTLLNCA
ncbi:unnamed protein product [Haemonchus placei]|uniref:Uncharacterized protein n=1 Tax=Haemonchus placei TaxID=6290 RepID=A0A3P7YL70_HAEPC|nr:unnamed protein product [Haemonchus placei]